MKECLKMSEQISINIGEVERIFGEIETQITASTEALGQIDKKIDTLETDGEWKGASYRKFMDQYNTDIRESLTTKIPELLTELNKNIQICKDNLFNADAKNG